MSLEFIASALSASKLALSNPKIESVKENNISQVMDVFKGPKNTEQNMRDLTKVIWESWGCMYDKEVKPGQQITVHTITCYKAGMNDFNIEDIKSQLEQIGSLSGLTYQVEYRPILFTDDNKLIPAKFILTIQNHL